MLTSALEPMAFVLFGATGDVVAKKVIPALFSLFIYGMVPSSFQIIAFARRPFTEAEFQAYALEIVKKQHGITATEEQMVLFSQLFTYVQGTFDQTDGYQRLAQALQVLPTRWNHPRVHTLIYLGVPPESYPPIFHGLAEVHITGKEQDVRVLVEKPIGTTGENADLLTQQMSESLQENQIYRIEHYLAKEMTRQLFAMRMSNDLLADVWHGKEIEHISVRLWESIGVESRGAFYDQIGALLDVGQNHLLQVLATTMMDRPTTNDPEEMRQRRAALLQTLVPINADQMETQAIRGQYQGYREIAGVAPESSTETYFSVTSGLTHPNWQNVLFTLEAGKRLSHPRKEVEILFRHRTPCDCPDGVHRRNRLVFSYDQAEGIRFFLWSKYPGEEWKIDARVIEAPLHSTASAYHPEGYALVFFEAMQGDQRFFVSKDELTAMWKFIDPIKRAWQANQVPLRMYTPDSDEITKST